MEEQTLNSSDLRRPVGFIGERLAYASTKQSHGKRKLRHWKAEVYKKDDGLYRIGTAYITYMEGERHGYWIDDTKLFDEIPGIIAQRITDTEHSDEIIDEIERQLSSHERKRRKKQVKI